MGEASTEHLIALEEARVALLSSARSVNTAQESYLRFGEEQRGLRANATELLAALQEANEGAIDGASGADVETLLRLGLS
ncbi:MAG: hypothetical protein AAF830_09555, partial [Pseudomonadota bacterium]